MSDSLEQALLIQFAPAFMVARNDCSNIPAEFAPGLMTPTVAVENGTIYGQVFPAKSSADGPLSRRFTITISGNATAGLMAILSTLNMSLS